MKSKYGILLILKIKKYVPLQPTLHLCWIHPSYPALYKNAMTICMLLSWSLLVSDTCDILYLQILTWQDYNSFSYIALTFVINTLYNILWTLVIIFRQRIKILTGQNRLIQKSTSCMLVICGMIVWLLYIGNISASVCFVRTCNNNYTCRR